MGGAGLISFSHHVDSVLILSFFLDSEYFSVLSVTSVVDSWNRMLFSS